MAKYRVVSEHGTKVAVSVGGARYYLDPGRTYDDRDATDKMLVARFPGRFEPVGKPGDVEQATAAPGEKRNTKRKATEQ